MGAGEALEEELSVHREVGEVEDVVFAAMLGGSLVHADGALGGLGDFRCDDDGACGFGGAAGRGLGCVNFQTAGSASAGQTEDAFGGDGDV